MDNELTLSDVSRGLNLWYDIQAVRTRYLGPKHEDPRQVMSFQFSGWYLSLMAVTFNIFVTIGYIHSHQLWPEFTNSLGLDNGPPDGVFNAFMFFALVNAFIATFCGGFNSSTAVARIDAEDAYRDYLKAEKRLVTNKEYRPSSPPRYPSGQRYRNDVAPFTVAIRIPSTEAAELSPLAVEQTRHRYIAMLTGGSYSPRPSSDCSGFNPHIVTPSQVAIPGKTRMTMEIVETPMGMHDNGRTEITCVRKELLC